MRTNNAIVSTRTVICRRIPYGKIDMRLYHLLRPLARLSIGIYYRKIHVSGLENIPQDKPVVFAANHPTAFTEPCILACWQPRDLHFLVRGDFFVHPAANWALRQLNQVPVYRKKDAGFEGIKNNFETFQVMYRLLTEGEAVMILAEGNTKWEKRLRPLQKGSARMLLGVLDTYPDLDVHLVPVGVNYTDAPKFRSEVMFEIGEPMPAQKYAATYLEKPPKAIREVTKELDAALRNLIVIIEDPADEALAEGLFTLLASNRRSPVLPRTVLNGNRFREEKRAANFVNQLEETEKEHVATRLDTYFGALKKLDITDYGLTHTAFDNAWTVLVLVFGFVPYIFGMLTNALPAYVTYWIGKEKVKAIEFKASIWAASGMGTFLVYYLILIAVGFMVGRAGFWLLLFFVPVLGYFSLLYRDYLVKYRQAARAARVPDARRQELLMQRADLLKLVSD